MRASRLAPIRVTGRKPALAPLAKSIDRAIPDDLEKPPDERASNCFPVNGLSGQCSQRLGAARGGSPQTRCGRATQRGTSGTALIHNATDSWEDLRPHA